LLGNIHFGTVRPALMETLADVIKSFQ